MAKAKYNTAEYVRARAAINAAQAAGDTLWCTQPVCLYSSREIPPHAPADVAHDDAGLVILGPAHARCNRSDGGRRGGRASRPGRRRPRVWIL